MPSVSQFTGGTLRSSLRPFSERTVAVIGGLQTLPELQTNQLRLECASHVAAAVSAGGQLANAQDLVQFLGADGLGSCPVARMEDPPEDVFAAPVAADDTYLLLQGINTGNAFYTQLFINATLTLPPNSPVDCQSGLDALLRLTRAVAARSGVERWATADEPSSIEAVIETVDLDDLADRVTFEAAELEHLGIDASSLVHFCVDVDERQHLSDARLSDSPLLTRPLVRVRSSFVLPVPSYLGPAIRRHIYRSFERVNRGGELCQAMASAHRKVASDCMPRFGGATTLLEDPSITGVPGLSRLRVQFDEQKQATVLHLTPEPGDAGGRHLDVRITRTDTEQRRFAEILGEAEEDALTLLLLCGCGGDIEAELASAAGEDVIVLGLYEFSLMALVRECTFLWIWKLQRHLERLEAAGLRVQTAYGFEAVVAEFMLNDGRPIPCDLPLPTVRGLFLVEGMRLHEQRCRTQSLHDEHGAPHTPGEPATVVSRLDADALFDSLTGQPVYASADSARSGTLAGVIEADQSLVWVCAQAGNNGPSEVAYLLWEAALKWTAAIVRILATNWPRTPAPRLLIDIQEPEAWEDAGEPDEDVGDVAMEATCRENTVLVRIYPGYRHYFTQPANHGDRELFRMLAESILRLVAPDLSADEREAERWRLEHSLMPNQDIRHIHLFDRPSPLDLLRPHMPGTKSRLHGLDDAPWLMALAGGQPAETLATSERCRDVLKVCAADVADRLRTKIGQFGRHALVTRSLHVMEEIAQQRAHFRRTARALGALYGNEATDVAAREEAERGLISQAAKVIAEIAVCEAPLDGHPSPEQSEYDDLLAGCRTLCRFGGYADAAHRGLIERAVICANGEVHIDGDSLGDLATHYTRSTQEHLLHETDHEYEHHFEVTGGTGGGPLWLDEPGTTAAFEAEYGATPQELGGFVASLIDKAIDAEQAVVESHSEEFAQIAISSGLPEERARRLLDRLSLWPRNRWDQAPEGYSSRDWYPWKYGRKLSVVSRPLVQLGDADSTVVYGVSSLASSFSYITHGIETGALRPEYFESPQMGRLVGRRVDERGREFTISVSDALRQLGWSTETEVPMARLGAPDELGDIDVLAWRAGSSTVLAVECKRLQPSYGLSGIVDRLVDFAGDATDRLGRHVRRLEWLEAHADWVNHLPHRDVRSVEVTGYLVTNRPVPFQFAAELPFPTERIITLRQFLEALSGTEQGA